MTVTALSPGSERVCHTARAGEGDGRRSVNRAWIDPDRDHLGMITKGEGRDRRDGVEEVEIGMTP